MNIFLDKMLLEKEFTQVFYEKEFHKIPFEQLNLDNFDKEYNDYNFLAKGDLFKYLIKPFELELSKSYKLLSNGEFFYAYEKSPIPQIMRDITKFGIIVNNRVFYIKYFTSTYETSPDAIFYSNLPKFILNSWLFRSDGWYVAEDSVPNIYKSRLPTTLKNPINAIIADFEDKDKLDKYCDFLESKFQHSIVRDYSDDKYDDREQYFELRNLLDTRNTDDYSNTGFQLFCSSTDKGENVYITQNTDVLSIKKLNNAQDALDNYAAHIFSGNEGEFDFSPFMTAF